jgi:hypothetical protein
MSEFSITVTKHARMWIARGGGMQCGARSAERALAMWVDKAENPCASVTTRETTPADAPAGRRTFVATVRNHD